MDTIPLIPAAEALARIPRALAVRRDALPLEVAGGVLAVAVADPSDRDLLDELHAAARMTVRAVAMPRAAIREALQRAYGREDSAAAPGAQAAQRVDRILRDAIAAHASDVHLDPRREGMRVRIRVDGVLRELTTIPAPEVAAVISRVKVLAAMDVADRRTPQDGRFAVPVERREVDARVASVPTLDGEKLVVRLLDRFAAAPSLDALGMAPELLARVRAAAAAPWGFVVVAGPTGSGKTTTLYAALAELDAATRTICAVEDPVEMRLDGISQVQVNARAGVTFPVVVRAFTRQDPNVVMIGEMRDGETAAAAIASALAGQIVFTTLHANDAPRAIDRLGELGVARQPLGAAITAILAQRLVRRLCVRCRVREALGPEAPRFPTLAQWFAARGCAACEGTGYLGRTGLFELLVVDDAVRDAIADGATSTAIARLAAPAYRPLRDGAAALLADGTTSWAELRRVVRWP